MSEVYKKIMLVNYALEMGGTDRVAVELAKIFSSHGHEVSFVTLKTKGQDFFELPSSVERSDLGLSIDDSKISGIRYFGFDALVSFFKLIRKIRLECPDVVVSNWTSVNCFVLIAAFFCSVKVVCIEHIHFHHPSILWRVLRKVLYPLAFKVVCLTDRDLVCYLRLGCDAVKIINPLTVAVRRLSPRGGKVFLAVGRLEFQKGFDLLLKAFKEVVLRDPEVTLRICGDGSEYENLVKLVEQLGLERSVELCGAVDDISKYYESSDFFVLSSRFEGFGLVIVEAQAHGLPVVSFDCPTGPSDIIDNYCSGLLVKHESIEALAGGMTLLLSDPALCEKFIGAGCRGLDRFSSKAIYARWRSEILSKNK